MPFYSPVASSQEDWFGVAKEITYYDKILIWI